MAARFNPHGSDQPIDAGLGLVYRLNRLWARTDYYAETGNYVQWEVILDRLWTNLLFKEDLEIKTNGNDEIVDVKLSEVDYEIRKILKKKIADVKLSGSKALRKKDLNAYRLSKRDHYEILMFYDAWLRKLMRKNKLYLKESSSNPSRAMWGG